MSRRVTWTALLAGAQAGDVATTWLGTRFGIPEDNPVVSSLLVHSSFLGFGIVKIVLVAALAGLLAVTGARLRGRVERLTWRSTQALTFFLTAVAAANTVGVLIRIA